MSNQTKALRIGTRKSALARVQTGIVVEALKAAHPHLKKEGAIEVVHIDTLGDMTQVKNLSLVEHGGKALWATEHEAAMREGLVDIAVHSVKDIPGLLPEDMTMPIILPRTDARDVFLSPHADHFEDLHEGAIVGTSSPRRGAVVLSRRPDIDVRVFRGNVDTRLKKLENGEVDGTFLALAGMLRLGLDDRVETVLEPEDMVPAVGQGALGLEFCKTRADLHDLLMPIHCHESGLRIVAERAWLAVMDGTCRSPIAAYAEMDGDDMTLTAFAARIDGSDTSTERRFERITNLDEAVAFGADLGREMKSKLPQNFFEAA